MSRESHSEQSVANTFLKGVFVQKKKTFHAALSTLEFQCPNITQHNYPHFSRVKILEGIKISIRKFYDYEYWKIVIVYYKREW